MASYMGEALNLYKKAAAAVKQVALNLSEMEIKVEEATNNEPWGPHGTVMTEIVEAAYDSEHYRDIMGVIARRLQEKDDKWRQVYKSLLLLEHMLKNGPMKVVHELRSNSSVIEGLQKFEYKDAKGKDHGINVRNRAKLLYELIQDPERITQEREKARENKNKYGGVARSDTKSTGNGGFGADEGSNSSSGYDTFERSKQGSQSESFDTSKLVEQDDFQSAPMPKSSIHAVEPPAEPTKKKLSDTKVNPNIANTFSKLAVSPAPKAAPRAAAATGDMWDAFSSAPAPQPAAKAAATNDTWDAFTAAPAPAAGGNSKDSWDAFSSAPAAPAQQDIFSQLSAPAASNTASKSVNDPFATFSAAPAPTADPFGIRTNGGSLGIAKPAVAGSTTSPSKMPLPEDLFGASPPLSGMRVGGGMNMMPQQPGGMMPQMGGGMGMPAGGFSPQMPMQGGMPGNAMGGFPPGNMGGVGMMPQGMQQQWQPQGGHSMGMSSPMPGGVSGVGPGIGMAPNNSKIQPSAAKKDPFADLKF